MGFLSGTTTFERYWITKDDTPTLGPDHLKVLEKFKSGKREPQGLDEPHAGFLAGAHLLDTKFDLEKNVIGDALHFAIRIDCDKIPAAIRNAWLQMELLPLMADNPSGKPTKSQREEAKAAVEAMCEQEAATGKFRRMQQVSVLWDGTNEVIYLGSTSASVNEVCIELLERAFDIELDRVTTSKLANTYASELGVLDQLYDVQPAAFTGEGEAGIVQWWNGSANNYDYLGNEFLLWLWWHFENESDTIQLTDDSSVVGMFARTLTLDCPRGESGKETISAESPVALPEAVLAIQSGKLPRKAGLTLVRNNEQYDLALQAETFAVGGGKISKLGDADPGDVHDRIASVRDFTETLDLLFDVFCSRRIGKNWAAELKRVQSWLTESETRKKSAA